MKTTRAILISMAACAATAAAQSPVDLVTPYVSPLNKPDSPTSFTYMPDGKTYLMLSDDGRTIRRYDIATGNLTEDFFDVSRTRENTIPDIEGFMITGDAARILVWRNSEPVYRHSFTAEYYVYDLHSRTLKPLSQNFKRQESPLISPDGLMVAFVAQNNIHIKKLLYDTEVDVTTDGKKNEIINGTSDWTYEEEFATTMSMAWAPDNLTLCYIRYDESAVPTYDMQTYEGTCDPRTEYALYPGTWSYKYPVAGMPNSTVSLHSYDVETRKIKDIPLPDRSIEYIPRIGYGPSENALIVATLNRDQNRLEIYSVNPKSTVAKSIYVEESRSWIDPVSYEKLVLAKDGFVINSWKSGYNQLYLYSYAGALTRTITSGNFDVTDYYGSDALGNHYYQAASPSPLVRTVYRVDRKGVITPLTKEGMTASASFSPDMKYMMTNVSDIDTPPVYTLCSSSGKELRKVVSNEDYAARFASKNVKREFFTMKTDGGTELNGYMMKPVGFDPSRKYPVVMYQYSGPGSQQVLNRWEMDWQQAFCHQGYAVICVDGRGTGGRGRDFCDIVYRCLGKYETIDQIAAARYAASLPWVDANRIGMFGWSFGGYETLMAASAQGAPYAAAVAVAPVTDWRFYDSIYTERYMRTPQQNEDGYRQCSPLTYAGNLHCPTLIMYGTADDNVHPANSLQYVSALQSKGLLCDMFVFPNMNHSINGCNARAVVYGNMLRYFNLYLK